MRSIFSYINYRLFLHEAYRAKKERDKKYSHRYFCDKVGVRSSGFFGDVISGKKNLSSNLIFRFAQAFGLKKEEQRYFEALVHFDQAKSPEEKQRCYENLLSFRRADVRVLKKKQFEYFRKWYYPVIRETLYYREFKEDYASLANSLNPPVRPDQAKSAIRLLEDLELIRKDEDGVYRQTDRLVGTGSDFDSIHVRSYQKQNMDLAKLALDKLSEEDRDLSTLTLTLSDETTQKAKSEIRDLRKRLLRMAQEDLKVDRVCHFNFQMFRVTKTSEKT